MCLCLLLASLEQGEGLNQCDSELDECPQDTLSDLLASLEQVEGLNQCDSELGECPQDT